MALADLTDPEAVRKAIAEFDERGRRAFLDEYGFSPAKDYFIVVAGKRYDSKAIAAVGHMHQTGVLLTAGVFSGGDSTVATRLAKLGFEVTHPISLPDCSVDELILALDLYLRTRGELSYSPSTKVVRDLSAELRSLRIFPDEVRSNPRFRNRSGVALKMHNFSSIDPDHQGQGMTHGGAPDSRVLERVGASPGRARRRRPCDSVQGIGEGLCARDW